MAGRFKLIADEHWSNAHIKALTDAGWDVVRVIDVLGQSIDDVDVLAYSLAQARVWLTSDERAKGHVTAWLERGKTLPGVVLVPQRHRISPGGLVRCLDQLAMEDAPFAGTLRFLPHD